MAMNEKLWLSGTSNSFRPWAYTVELNENGSMKPKQYSKDRSVGGRFLLLSLYPGHRLLLFLTMLPAIQSTLAMHCDSLRVSKMKKGEGGTQAVVHDG
jgi:hypothetical protein